MPIVFWDALAIAVFRQGGVLAISDAPQAALVDLDDYRPIDGIDHEIRPRKTLHLEIVGDVGGDEPHRPGVAVERQAERIAHRAAAAVRPNQPWRAQPYAAVGRVRRDGDAGRVLG